MVIDYPFIIEALKEIVKALPLTLFLTFTPVVIGFIIGLIVTVIRENNIKVLLPIANAYVSFFRGTPVIMHIMIFYYGIPMLLDVLEKSIPLPFKSSSIPILLFVLMALSLTAGSYMSEIIRSGISSVSKGQMEAAYSIGMNSFQAIRRILLPQALAKSIPNFTNILIGFLHTTSIAFLVSQKELTGTAKIVASSNLKFLEAYIAAGILYWVVTLLLEGSSHLIEKRVKRYSKGGVA